MSPLKLFLAGIAALAVGVYAGLSVSQVVPQPGPPMPTACAYNTTPPTLTNGQAGWVQCDSTGHVVVGTTGSSIAGLAPVVCGSAVSSCVLKASPGNLFSVYAECTATCWLMVFNRVDAPTNGATTAGSASGNMVECVPVNPGGVTSIANSGMPPTIYTVGIVAVISSTTCATLTLATTGFINGKVQ